MVCGVWCLCLVVVFVARCCCTGVVATNLIEGGGKLLRGSRRGWRLASLPWGGGENEEKYFVHSHQSDLATRNK